MIDDGLVTIDSGNISVTPYRRTPVPATEFAAELRKSDVFIVTHPESLGLTVLEAAMCGALILTLHTLPSAGSPGFGEPYGYQVAD